MGKNGMGAIIRSPVSNIHETFAKYANKKNKGVTNDVYGEILIRKDSSGYIMVPLRDELKSGWGPCAISCFKHFKERNAKLL